MPDRHLNFVHRYVAPTANGSRATLLLLHGTGGDENDLLPIGEALAPGAGYLSPRGKVLENGMPRFFRRLAEGVFDQADLALRTRELTEFVERASDMYGLWRGGIVAAGYSNGANIAVSMLLRQPDLLAAAVLFRPMVPFVPDRHPDLSGKAAFLSAGRHDPIVPPHETKRLETLLKDCGAEVSLHWGGKGHGLEQEDVRAARDWLAHWMALRIYRSPTS
jgi:phospholipase/carboxylesterase/glyoxalase family protein